ncbi:hypothetical protein [Tahibacter amnicola]|uniref:Uncharacterized protein n=1 Tax=Tahibacter amnicola TaxID=2976241 RepID=A0ABY6BBZ2_9GAMM|nr:hypothetical protein [Tahibacter amnicola]UXI66635.1 hypothetical protein N4264_18020 [Tahibacter amnicola]
MNIRRAGGALALGGSVTFTVLVSALHLLQPEYDARYQLMSGLALGRDG